MPDIGLSPQQLAVICALSSGATTLAAAELAGVHRNTITNWRRNLLLFQRALAGAQYDRALYFREKMEELVDLAIQSIHQILADPNTPPSVRLKAALTIIQTAATPPEPKKQIELDIQKVVIQPPEPVVHNPAQPEPQMHNPAQPEPEPPVHNNAQPAPQTPVHSRPFVAPTPARNAPCPCRSGLKYKRCCMNNHKEAAAA